MAGINTNIKVPYSSFLDPTTGRPSQAWLLWLMNPSFINVDLGNALAVTSGGTGLSTIPTNGQLLIGNGTGYTLNTLGAGAGISVINGSGTISVANTGVLSFSAGTTGLTPATATTGDVTLAGTLIAANGGTGFSSYAAGDFLYANSITTLAKLPAGTAGYFLKTQGAATPTWSNSIGGYIVDGTSPYLDFANGSAVTLAAGRMWYNGLTGSWNLGMGNGNITQQVGEEFFRYGKASAPISDTNLQLIYKTGVVGASGVITFAPAVAGITDPDQIIGIATETIPLNGFGRVTTMGVVNGINTTGSVYGEVWADNDDIWYNPVTGGLTKNKPSAPNIKLQVGTVINAGGGGSGSFNVNLGSTSQLGGTDSNVQLGTLADADLLQYDSANQYWTNVPVSSVQMLTWIEP